MSDAKLVNIAKLMTTYNLEIEQLPEDLKCAQCKLVLKDACQGPCCCRFCRVCLDDMITRGGEFCPGDSEDCGESHLTRFVSDFGANKRISRLTVECPHDGCVHECQLANIEQHLRECQRKSEKCPFRELGCTHDKLAADEMGGHLQHDNRRHSELLIEMISNISREIETLKQKDEVKSREIETLKQRDEANSREIETLKQRDEASSREIETLKHGLVLKDEQTRLIMEQMINVQNEIKSIKEEKEDLAGQVRILTEKIEQEIAERRQNDELDLARVIEHVDTEIAAITRLIGSNKSESVIEMQSVRGNIGSIKESLRSIKGEISSVKSQVQSVQALVGLGQIDVSFVQLIDVTIDHTYWDYEDKISEYFTREMHPYKYRLASWNCDIGTAQAALYIQLLIDVDPNDEELSSSFEARVDITVTDRDKHEACRSVSLQCRIGKPLYTVCFWSNPFKFLHSELKGAGLNLSRGVRVSCVIVPGTG